MSLDVITLALAKSYTNQHGGGGGGASTAGDFIIKMTVEDNGGNYTVTSCDATVEQIDTAVAAEKRVVVIASVDGALCELPMLQGVKGDHYYFGIFFSGSMMISSVYKVDGNTSKWEFSATQIEAESIGYSNTAMPRISTVGGALDALVPESHTHANKDTLDKLSVSNGKLQYNGSDVGLKGADGITPTIGANGNWYLDTTDTGKPSRGEKGDTGAAGADGYTPVKGTDYWTAADKAEIVNDTLAALPTWTGGNY